MVASNLDEAYLAFDPLKPLSGEQLQLYYVGREPNPIDRIRAILLGSPDTPDKILFIGHRGWGDAGDDHPDATGLQRGPGHREGVD